MAVDNTAKKSDYISAVKANAALLKQARDGAVRLREQLSSDAVIAGIVDADCVGTNAYLTRAIIDNYLLGVTVDLEKMLTNQAVATSNRLPSYMAAQSTS